MQLSSLIAKPSISLKPAVPSAPASAPPASAVREDKRAMFESVERADADLDNAKRVADAMLFARSALVEQILMKYGKGPFMYKGQPVRIIKRKSDDGKRIVYFFRAVSKNEPEEIG